MKFSKIVLISLLFMMFLFISSCDDNNIEITDDKTEETNNNEDKKDDNKDSKDDGSKESNPDDGIDWPSEIVWP